MGKNGESKKTRAALAALDASYARSPDQAVAQTLEEARDLLRTVKRFGKELVRGSRLDKKLIGALGERRALVEALDDGWRDEQGARAEKPARKARKAAEELRRDMVAALRYFLEANAAVQAEVDRIQEGTGLVDLLDDLGKLAGLVERHARALERADLPADAPARARGYVEQLSEARSAERLDAALSDALGLRNRAYWWLREAIDEIRAAGRYVYRHDPKKLALFRAASRRRAPDAAAAAPPGSASGG
jgi:hypothetical protein